MSLISRGSIYMASLPVSDKHSSVQGGLRPVLIIQNDVGNAHAPTVQVIPLTSKIKKELPIHTIINSGGLLKESTALTEQIQTINKTTLRQYIGKVDDATMNRVNVCIMIQLGLMPIKST
jgi:mRNA interferase MazF